MFWVWVQFARAHKSADKCGGNSGTGWLCDCGNHGYWVTMLMHAVPASIPPCTWHLYAPHIQLPATGEQLQSKRGSEAGEEGWRRGKGELPLLATEFLQTLQCVSFVIENCRTRESAVSKIYGPTCNGFFIDQPRPIKTSPLPPTGSWIRVGYCGYSRATAEAVAKLIKWHYYAKRVVPKRVFKVSTSV